MTKKLDISSDFAILDVKKGRGVLHKHFEKAPTMGRCPEELRIPVVIHGYIDGVWGNDDGVSREFSLSVEKIETP